MIRNIIFDMGNVLLDYEPLLACYRHTRDWVVAEKLNKAIFGTHDWCTLVDGGLMDDKEYAQLMRSKMETPQLGALAAAVLSDWWVDSMYQKSGMDALVKELLDAAMPLYILSNVGYNFYEFSYKIPSFERFSGVVLSCEEKLRKPDPELFRRMCERYSLNPAETLFVDDWAANIEGAQSIGMQGYCFADGNVASLRDYIFKQMLPASESKGEVL